MKISTEIQSIYLRVGYEEAIKLVAKAGFDCFDLSLFHMIRYDKDLNCLINEASPFQGPGYLKYVRELRKIAEDNGITCNQSHAPYPTCQPAVRDSYKRAIECTAEMGGKICVIHPDNDKCAEENADFYLELLPFAKGCNVKIATENMWNWDDDAKKVIPAACSSHEDFLKHVEAVNDPFLVACLDIGHAEMVDLKTSSLDMIHTLGHHLQALHLHDNNLVDDTHQLPNTMQIDFPPILKALKEINYAGEFTLEAVAYLQDYSDDNLLEGVKKMAESARHLADMYEAL